MTHEQYYGKQKYTVSGWITFFLTMVLIAWGIFVFLDAIGATNKAVPTCPDRTDVMHINCPEENK